MLDDPDGSTGKAYGLERPVNVYIGPDRKIVGFDQGFVPEERTLNAVLDSRTTLTRPTPDSMKAFLQSNRLVLDAEPRPMLREEDRRPQLTPSDTVHITASESQERVNSSAEDFWVLRGFTLPELIEELYQSTPVRTRLPASLDLKKRYDLTLSLPKPEQREQMTARLKAALLDYFQLTARPEVRLTPVYIVTSTPGRHPQMQRQTAHHFSGNSSVSFSLPNNSFEVNESPGPVRVDILTGVGHDGSLTEFCHGLEGSLDRPVVNETALKGFYQFHVSIPQGSREDFLKQLRLQTGLVITAGQRDLEIQSFRSR